MAKKKAPTKKKAPKAAAPKRRPKKQQAIPGTAEPEVEELESIAAELSHQHQEQMTAKNACSLLRGRMLAAMQRHGRTLYECDGVRFEIVAGDDKLKLKMLSRDDEGDEAEAAE